MDPRSEIPRKEMIGFAADSSLGKLAKWLRILGFDALYVAGRPGKSLFSFAKEKRVLLTRSTALLNENPGFDLIFIRPDNPKEQVRQVVRETHISFSDIRPFSRCIRCNLPLAEMARQDARGQVPEYVYETATYFRRCPGCRRVYWPGTHSERAAGRIRELFHRSAGGEQ